MASLGNIFVKLGLDTKPFEKGMRRARNDSRSSVDKIRNGLGKLKAAFVALGAVVAVRIFKGFVDAAAEYETAVTGVVKTTGLAGTELLELEDRLSGITRRFAATKISLLGLAEAAGQMGVQGAADLARFSETMARMAVSSDVAGEEGGKAIVRMLSITGEGVGVIDRFGSTLVKLGQRAKASESEILHMASRVGQNLAAFNVSSKEVLGLASAMRSLDLTAELSGTAIGRAFQTINKSIQEGGDAAATMAERLGVSVSEMQEEFKTRPMESFLRFLKMLKDEGDRSIITLDEMGLSGSRNALVFPLLANNVDQVRDSLERASEEWENNTALMDESAQFNKTFASQVVIFQNALRNLSVTIGQAVLPALTSILTEINFVFDSGEQRVDNFDLFVKAKFLDLGKWLVDQMITVGVKIARSFASVGSTIVEIFSDSFDQVLIGLESIGNSFADFARFISGGHIDLGKTDFSPLRFNFDTPSNEELEKKIRGFISPTPDNPFTIQTGDYNKFQSQLNANREAYTKMLEAKAKFDENGLPGNDAAGELYNLTQGVDELGEAMDDVSRGSRGYPQGDGVLDAVLFGGRRVVAAKVKETEEAVNGFSQGLTELQIHGTRVFDGFFDMLARFAETGKLEFKAFARSAIIELAKIQLKALATRAILNLSQSGGWVGSVFSGLANAFLGGTTARALGGPVVGGQPYLVGEKGPELMIPRSSGTVIPNNELRSGSSNGGQAIVIHQENIYQGNASPRDMLVWAQQTRDATIQAVSQMIQNGGQPASQFAQ